MLQMGVVVACCVCQNKQQYCSGFLCHCSNSHQGVSGMRLLISSALATYAVVAFKQPRQDSPVVLAHQQAYMDSAVKDLRTLKQEVPTVSYGSRARRLAAACGMFTSCFKGQSRAPSIRRQDSLTASQRLEHTQWEFPIQPQAQQRQGRTQRRQAPQRQVSMSGRSSGPHSRQDSSSPVRQYSARLEPR
ncbi:hypothetical protein AC1031_004124 [Aphanomyces cochlioides]|nr:hypothetical protein AC1031_004124 [Aphanomyces cochlioides]